MSMQPDLTLPSKAPTELFHGDALGKPFAVYMLADFQDGEAEELRKFIASDEYDVRFAPRYNFAGQALRAVFDYHLKLAEGGIYHPTLFVVAVQKTWSKDGVLLVSLNCDGECGVDTCRMRAEDVASAMVNLEIANMDWEEFKDSELPSVESVTAGLGGTIFESADNKKPPHHTFGIYTTAGANMTNIRVQLEPDWDRKQPEDYICEFAGNMTAYPDPWGEVLSYHPFVCRRVKALHRQLFICADKKDVEKEGVLLCKMDWDGNIDREDVLEVGNNENTKTRRCPVGEAASTLVEIADHKREWED
ncbi:hypothetical protein GP486_000429 [Trichoglossum hirsutum]|uniref:DUF6924 domain-containing protein n=1 Tax=Trichoglossum hirsutum TaxID=265104 RepID=A0A9P8RTN3_9PEZI|nr:hypothetical protein GP486_000429 [Trichoglossum hirsutum]